MTSTSSTATVDELVRAYDQLGIPPKFPPQEARVLIGVWRALAEGVPVTPQRVAEIAAGAGMTEGEATEFLKGMSEKDDDGNILGTMGLTQTEWSQIKFNVEGQQLRTWCALDAIFLPLMLNKTAKVEVPSAPSGGPIYLTLGPAGIDSVDPPEAVMSTVVPSISERAGVQSVEEIWMIFCHHSLFFRSRSEAEEWAAGKESLDISVLSIEEAYEVASRAFQGLRHYAN